MPDESPRPSEPEARPAPATERVTESFEKAARTGSAQMMADSVPVADAGSVTEVPSALAGPAPAADTPSSPPVASDGGGTE